MDVRVGTIKTAEYLVINAFEMWCRRRLLRVSWTAKRSNQSIIKGNQSWIFIARTDVEVETPNTLATWCKELTHWKRPWWKERLKAGGERDNRGWDSWMASPTWQTWVWASSESWWWTGKPGMLQSYGVAKSQTLLRDWTYSYISSHWVIHF